MVNEKPLERDDKNGGKNQIENKELNQQQVEAGSAAEKLLQASQASFTSVKSGESTSEGNRFNRDYKLIASEKTVNAKVEGYEAAPDSLAARYTYAAAHGLARTPEGILNAISHDLHNPDQLGAKLGVAAGIGVVMKTVLPKAGVAKAIVGTVMVGALIKDAAKPLWEAKEQAEKAEDMVALDKAATTFSAGVGHFAWDTAIGGVVGLKAEKLTGRVLESRMGTANYAAFERAKVDFYSGDKSVIGKTLNSITAPIDNWTKSVADRFKPKQAEFVPSPEGIAKFSEAQAKHAADYKSIDTYLNGVRSADGKPHGFKETMDLIEMGKDPRQLSADDAKSLLAAGTTIAKAAPEGTAAAEAAPLAGQTRSIMGPRDQGHNHQESFEGGGKTPKEGGTAKDGTASEGKPAEVPGAPKETGESGSKDAGDHAKVPSDAGKPADAPTPPAAGDDVIKIPATAPAANTYVTAAEKELNVHTLTQMAEMNRKDMARWNDEKVLVADALDQMVGPMHAATTPSYKPLDPGYQVIRDAMQHWAGQVKGQKDLEHIYPLFSRAWMAANQHIGMGLNETNAFTHEFNLFGREIHSSLVANMKKAGIDPDVVLKSKNPPLFSISADGGAGPHTMRQIDGVWPLDHVLYPRNMVGTRSTTSSGIYGHEIGHDQYGGILKFDESIRESVIKDAVKNGLVALEKKLYGTETGRIANEKVVVPGHGEMTKADLYEHIFKAQADENTADIWGAAWTGHNGGGALGILLQSLRKGGQLETRNVYGKEFHDPIENPLGFEVHAFDALRPKIVAETMRFRANGDKRVLENADALDRYAQEASRPGDYVFGNIDSPNDRIIIPRQELEAVVPQLIKEQMTRPLPALQGKTFADVLPDLPSHMAKMDSLATLIADAVVKGKKPTEIPFDVNQYTINQVFGAGMPASLKLVAGGMDATKANAEVNRMSDFLRSQFHSNDPHVTPLKPGTFQAFSFKSPSSFAQSAVHSGRILGDNTKTMVGRMAEAAPQFRDNVAMSSSFLAAGAGSEKTGEYMRQLKKDSFAQARATSNWLKAKDTTALDLMRAQQANQALLGQDKLQ